MPTRHLLQQHSHTAPGPLLAQDIDASDLELMDAGQLPDQGQQRQWSQLQREWGQGASGYSRVASWYLRDNAAGDILSYGVLMWELLTWKHAFDVHWVMHVSHTCTAS